MAAVLVVAKSDSTFYNGFMKVLLLREYFFELSQKTNIDCEEPLCLLLECLCLVYSFLL